MVLEGIKKLLERTNIIMTKPIYLVAGARPNFIKLAPLVWVLHSRRSVPFQIVHTGQHYDHAMSQTFFDVLNIPEPDINLEVGSGTQSLQTARILERFDGLLEEKPPSAVVVFGDVNSTLACSLAAAKRQIPVVHVEAGLRSFDRSMPEEINRLVTDALSDLLLVSENSGMLHLQQEGIPDEKVRLVGNIMINSLVRMQPKAIERQTAARLGVEPGQYALLTLHRPSNVDDPGTLSRLLDLFADLSRKIPFVFPGPSPHEKADRISWLYATRRFSLGGAGGLPGFALPAEAGQTGPDRLGRHPGRDQLPGHSLPDAATKYRTSRYRGIGHIYHCGQ